MSMESTLEPPKPLPANHPLAIRGNENALLRSFKSLSDETRIRILHILSYADFSVNELVEILGSGQSSVSRHLKILTDAGLLGFRREGSWVYYGLRGAPNLGFTGSGEIAQSLIVWILSFRDEIPYRDQDQKMANAILSRREATSREFFDGVGVQWERVQEEVLDPRVYRDRVVESLPAQSQLLLDLGCGPGGLIPFLLSKAERVLGIDSSEKMVEISKQEFSGNPQVTIQEAALENLPVDDGSADTVVASMVLHHISNPPKVISEVSRSLKPGGCFTLVDLEKHNQEFMREKYADLWMGFEPELVKSWLGAAGLETVEEEIIPTNSVFNILFIKAKKKEDIYVRN